MLAIEQSDNPIDERRAHAREFIARLEIRVVVGSVDVGVGVDVVGVVVVVVVGGVLVVLTGDGRELSTSVGKAGRNSNVRRSSSSSSGSVHRRCCRR